MTEIYLLKTDVFENECIYNEHLADVSETRRKKVLSFKFKKDRFLSLGAGLLINRGLKRFGLSEKNIKYYYNENEKPYIADRNDIFFNVSHSGKYSVCAFSDSEIGIDIEEMTDVFDELINSVCTCSEKKHLMALSYNKRKNDFFRLWTAKESYMKMLGTGLNLHPQKNRTFARRQYQHHKCRKEHFLQRI